MSFLTPLLSAIAVLKVKDLGEIEPNLGRTLERIDKFGGVGVVSISPVEVRTTPFIAVGM